MTNSPFFSIVIPTRNRPELVQFALASVSAQDFDDFEVIVSDNYTSSPCEEIVKMFKDERFHYVRPPQPLSMSDNWDFGCSHAKGEYVMVLIDKTYLRPDALSSIKKALVEKPAELVSFWNEMYDVLTQKMVLPPDQFNTHLLHPINLAIFHAPMK